MRLLFLSNLYPPYDLGGLEQLCQEVTEALRARGHAVHVLTSRHGVAQGEAAEADVTRTLRLQADVHHYRLTDLVLRASRERSNQKAVREAIRRTAPDLVLVWGMWDLSRRVAYWAEQMLPGRVAYYLASYWPSDPDIHEAYWRAPATRPIVNALLHPVGAQVIRSIQAERAAHPLQFRHVMCCSNYVRDRLVQTGVPAASCGVVYCGIDPEPFLRPVRAAHVGLLRLVYCGRLVADKGVHTALEALGLLKERGLLDRVHLTILGGGHPEYVARLHGLVEKLDLREHVGFVGQVPRTMVPARLAEHDVFLFTSIWPEPFGRVISEAMVSGLVVIGSEAGGARELLAHGQTALTFQPGDAAGLADRIAQVVADPGLRRSLAETGQKQALEKFRIEDTLCALERWLEDLVT
ncbi:MAG: glycosyltransferase family 4 protein [Anaerolineae bacterium]